MHPPLLSTDITAVAILLLVYLLRVFTRGSKCDRFGHIPNPGYGRHYNPINSGEGYFRVVQRELDGVGTRHASLHTECERCGKKYQIGRIHIPKGTF
jgi:hypothetical protein